ncbi:hypothetical protein K501DRAFT_331376 [Backusella circina FSU 941]|nr:hypothetical protein K501DRAFT_331376 [Backusella circina FSU 941]
MQVRNEFEEIKHGQVGIQVRNEVLVTLTRKIQTGTVGSILNFLKRSKSMFIGYLMSEIIDMNINLDLVIAASSQKIEDNIVKVISEYKKIDFISLKDLDLQETRPVFGVLISLRRKDKKRHFRLRADFILFFDLMVNKERYVSLFSGVHYKKPQVVSLVCLRTPDVPVSNYKNQYPSRFTDIDTRIRDLPPNEADLFRELDYPEMGNANRCYYNHLVVSTLAKWMSLKDNNEYKPTPLAYTMLPYKSLTLRHPIFISDTKPKSDVSIYQSMFILEDALDKAHADLYQTIYGDY